MEKGQHHDFTFRFYTQTKFSNEQELSDDENLK